MANILYEVQNFLVEKLSSDSELSGNCTFIAENKKDIEYEIKNALGRQGVCGIVMTPKALYAGKFEDQSLVWQLDELEIDIIENVTVNRGKKNGNYMTGQDIAMQMFNVLCPLSGENEGQFSPVSLEEGEDNGLLVNKCVFKCLVHGGAEEPEPSPEPLQFSIVKLLAEEPPLSVTRKDGWIWPSGDQFILWSHNSPNALGDVTAQQMSAFVTQKLGNYYTKAETSSAAQISTTLADYYTKSETSSAAQISAALDSKADKTQLDSYYTKNETSSAAELSAAVGLKQDKLTEQQLKRIDTPCIPLMISSNVEVSGSNFLDFNCVTRFHNYTVFNGAIDTAQLNLRNDELDTQTSLSAFNERTIGIIGGFSNELTASLPVKNGEIAYTSDIAEQVSSLATKSELSAGLSPKADLSAVQSQLSGKLDKSGGTVSWLGVGRPEQRIAADQQKLGYVFSIDEYGSALLLPQRNVDVNLLMPSADGTLATLGDLSSAMSAVVSSDIDYMYDGLPDISAAADWSIAAVMQILRTAVLRWQQRHPDKVAPFVPPEPDEDEP